MPERDSASPRHDPDARLSDLFENLPEPTQQIPMVDDTPPAPGSRRAAREAASRPTNAGSGRSQEAPSPSPAGAGDSAEPRAAVEPRQVDASTRAVPADGSERTTVSSAVPAASAAAADASSSATPPRAESPDSRSVERDGAGGRLEDLFHSHPEEVPGGRPPKKKRRTGCLVALVIILVIVGGLAATGVWAMNTYGDRISDALGWGEPDDWEPGLATGEVIVTIAEGDTGSPVSASLYEAGVTRTETVFYDYLVDEGIAVTFYPGNYRLQEKMTAEAALDALRNPDNKLENTANVGEGATIESTLPGIAESLSIPLADLEAAVADPSVYGVSAQTLEGWLFPALYTFDPGVTAQQVIQRMVDRTHESLDKAGVPAEDAQRVLTIASIIQREGLTADFPKVSRVIQNRLDIDMKLQMDSTAQYGYGSLHEGVVSSSAEALEDPNDWNTYVHTGLPITPIASASDAAIDAAMHPADGPWLYFVTVNLATGETQFSETYEEHLKGVEKWGEWCKANPDGGCSAG